jgi:hypothetical protein
LRWSRISLRFIRATKKHDPEKWRPVFGSDHAQEKEGGGTPADAYPTSAPISRGAARVQRHAPPVGVPPRHLVQRTNAAPQLRTRFLGQRMIRKSGNRFSEKIMRNEKFPSPAIDSQAGRDAGRAYPRSRPGAKVTSPCPREPHSPHRPVSPADVLHEHERDSAYNVTGIGTNVKEKVTRLCAPKPCGSPALCRQAWAMSVCAKSSPLNKSRALCTLAQA